GPPACPSLLVFRLGVKSPWYVLLTKKECGRLRESDRASHPKCLRHTPLSCGRLRTSRSSQRSKLPCAPNHSSRRTDRTVPYRHQGRRSDLQGEGSDPRLSAPLEAVVRRRLVHYG